MKNTPDNNPLDKLTPILKMDLDKNLCTCNEVPKMDIINAIIGGATTLEEVQKHTYAMDGIGCCKRQIKQLIDCLCD